MDFIKISLLFIFITTGLVLTNPAFPKNYKAKKEKVNIRIDSTTSSKSIGNLNSQEIVEVVQEKYNWYKIKLPSRLNCWVWSDLVKKINKDKGIAEGTNINIRSKPSLDGAIIGSLDKNNEVIIRNENKDWLQINCHPYACGWVHSKLLEKVTPKEEKINPYKKITKLSKKGKNNPELISHFFAQAKSDSFKNSALYLDVLQNIILEYSPKLPFYYLAKKNKLSDDIIQKAYTFLKNSYK
ncbi:MAG: SH3 domain-containing protein [Candidatus Omnitrophica bacterium]|nr:SH3 domain-containing protein [Candidatus Omnitrophota bacterium]MCF7894296.1 SH3 domain-containing protein [Candidatus Omnitrophota bacterium]